MTWTVRLAGAAALLVLLLATSARADDHVRHTAGGLVEHWAEPAVRIRFDPALLPGDGAERAALIAAAAWAAVPGAPELVVDGPTTSPGPAAFDGENGIYLVHSWPFEPGLLAVTVSTVSASGEILDADVLVNDAHPLALLDDADASRRSWDLGAVLTHECGHVLGLAENHDDSAATMWPLIHRGSMSARTPNASDAASILEAYATRSESHAYSAEPGTPVLSRAGCSVTRSGAGGASTAVPLFALAVLVVATRRKRR